MEYLPGDRMIERDDEVPGEHLRLAGQGGPGYTAEVSLSITETLEEFTYHLAGRADGPAIGEEG